MLNYKNTLMAVLLLTQTSAFAGKAGEGGLGIQDGSAVCNTTVPVQIGNDGPLAMSSIFFKIREGQGETGAFPVIFWSNEAEVINDRVVLRNPGKQGNTLDNEYTFHGTISETAIEGKIYRASCVLLDTQGCSDLVRLSGNLADVKVDSNATIRMSSKFNPQSALGFPAFKTFQMNCRK